MPVVYDPFAPEVVADPYPYYRRLRDEAPVHRQAERDIWVVSRYHDVLHVLRDPGRFSSRDGAGYARRAAPLLGSDPPDHGRLRRLVQRHFSAAAVEAWRPRIDEIVRGLVDAAMEAGESDLVATLAGPLPVAVITELVGVPTAGLDRFEVWAQRTMDVVAGHLDPDVAREVEADVADFARFVAGVYMDRQADARPGTDVLATLVAAAGEDGVAGQEVVFLVMLLLMAGHMTTTHLVANVVLALVSTPGAWDAVAADHSLVPAAVEESLRHDAPTQGLFRTAREDVELHGTVIPAGGRVLVLYGSANRDERCYEDPDTFVVDRRPVDHLAFGSGIHACLGSRLARLEASVALGALVGRARTIELAGDVVRTANPLLRGLEHLPVRLRAR